MESLKRELAPIVADQIEKEMVEEFRAKIKPIIQEKIQTISFEHIEHMRDVMKMRDELHLYINGMEIKKDERL